MEPQDPECRHHDVHIFDDIRCCLACGETVFDSTPNFDIAPQHGEVTPYQYAELNYALGQEVRLVVLFPGQQSDDILIDIVHVNLMDRPSYEATSYAWANQEADASLSQSVYCRGRYIPVTKNCEAALRCLRRKGRKRYLWVDAISIDQGNIAERNHQVAFMSEIYRRASQVLIYLGGSTEETNTIFDYLNGDALALHQIKRDKVHLVVKAFVNLRWFSRVWVLQEVAFAQLATIIAGDRTAQWTSVSIDKVLHLCKKTHIFTPSALRFTPASQPNGFILDVLHKSRNCSATDPRDKVFAVIGLMSEEDRLALTVEYSLSCAQVFLGLAVYMIDVRKDLNLIRYATCQHGNWHAHATSKERNEIPTWVPRWDVWTPFEPLPPDTDLVTLQERYLSPGPSFQSLIATEISTEAASMLFQYLPSADIIMPTAAWSDWLNLWLHEAPYITERPSSQWVRDMSLALTQARAPKLVKMVCSRYVNPKVLSLALWTEAWDPSPTSSPPCLRVYAHRLATVKNSASGTPMRGLTSLPAQYSRALFPVRRYCSMCAQHFVAKPICQTNPSVQTSIIEEFKREATKFGLEKFPFSTGESLGFTQAQVNAGDTVWLLPNVNVLFLLRKVEQHYEMIGECYLYRVLRPHPCLCCGVEVKKWTTVSEIIDIW
ncbi:unnamed protein product [Periconia digitata]|uniref:Heterokaryon incompatibility domain-containing protein n=1 Tax=Periconia digitata TaxID=1303443 RepID=A0A9W4UHX4_9PLEO|nr:unnamed protein product [Periconia digitata]